MKVEVDADVEWEKDEPYRRGPRIESYCITNHKIVPADAETTGSFLECVGGDDGYDYEDDDLYFDIPESALEESAKIDLDIIAKTYMNGGYCFMGIDKNDALDPFTELQRVPVVGHGKKVLRLVIDTDLQC